MGGAGVGAAHGGETHGSRAVPSNDPGGVVQHRRRAVAVDKMATDPNQHEAGALTASRDRAISNSLLNVFVPARIRGSFVNPSRVALDVLTLLRGFHPRLFNGNPFRGTETTLRAEIFQTSRNSTKNPFFCRSAVPRRAGILE